MQTAITSTTKWTTTWTTIGLVVVLAVLACGCQMFPRFRTAEPVYFTQQPVDYFISPHFFRLQTGRVVMVIPKSRENSYEVQSRFAETMSKTLSRIGVFEVILQPGICEIGMDSIRNGTFDERQLVALARRHNADGVLFCETTTFSPYEPLHLGCALTLVDTRETIVTLHTNGVWDASLENVRSKFYQEVCRIHKCKAHAAGAYFRSPTEFMNFVAHDLTKFLQENIHKGLTDQPPL